MVDAEPRCSTSSTATWATARTRGIADRTPGARAPRPDRLLLRRVRHPRVDADLLRRPRHPGRRPLQVRVGRGPAVHRRRPPLPAWLLPPADRRRRPPGARPAGPRPRLLPLRRARGRTARRCRSSVDFPDREVHAAVWVAQVGRVPLLLLDTDLPANDGPTGRSPTSSTCAVARCASARSSCWGSAACGRCGRSGIDAGGLAPERGPLRVPAARARARAVAVDGPRRSRGAAARSAATPCSPSTPRSPPATRRSTRGLVAHALAPWLGRHRHGADRSCSSSAAAAPTIRTRRST